jgi:hypothetical protein
MGADYTKYGIEQPLVYKRELNHLPYKEQLKLFEEAIIKEDGLRKTKAIRVASHQ